jgi:hypothetical protein
MQTWRYLLTATAVLFVAGVALQFLLIGLALTQLGGNGDAGLHINLGYWLPIVPLLSLILCWPARAGGRLALLVAFVFVDTFIQGILPVLRDSVPAIAALHPVNALIIFGLGLVVARRSLDLARSSSTLDAAERSAAGATPRA